MSFSSNIRIIDSDIPHLLDVLGLKEYPKYYIHSNRFDVQNFDYLYNKLKENFKFSKIEAEYIFSHDYIESINDSSRMYKFVLLGKDELGKVLFIAQFFNLYEADDVGTDNVGYKKLKEIFNAPIDILKSFLKPNLEVGIYYWDSSVNYFIFSDYIKSLEHKKDKDKASVGLIIPTDMGYKVKSIDTKFQQVDVKNNYEDGTEEFVKKMIEILNTNNKKGLYLLDGEPGTGKTSLVRHIISHVKKQVVFLPPHMVEALSTPAFTSFLINNANCVLVIEDAEKAIMDRASNISNSAAVSTILNMTDGLLADLLSIQVILTCNVSRNTIDPAITRKGRLTLDRKIDALSVSKANALLKKLNKNYVTDKPMTLADIYNLDDKPFENKKQQIGFIKN